jgi:DNA-binding SARP family transcriptional activator/TolB-like protein/Tfp pilus assembly protein PilF
MSSIAAGQSTVETPARRPAPQRATRPIVRIHLIGPMRAITYLGQNAVPRGKKARAILGCLCLAPSTAMPQTRLAAMLWDATDIQAQSSFGQALNELRLAVGPLADELISIDREIVTLNADACWIDALALLESSSPDSTRSDLAVLCAGELLEGLEGTSASFDRWLARERTRFSGHLRKLLESELHHANPHDSDPNQVAAVARRLIAFDATHEGASRALMRALAEMGERSHALREYARCRRALRKTSDTEPSLETKALSKSIRAFSRRNDQLEAIQVPAQPQRDDIDTHRPLPGRSRLRVGVLPFDGNRSENEGNLAFSLSHEIAAALARFRWFDVITPVSMMRRPLANFVNNDLPQHQQLDYAVDGTITVSGRHIQINVRLLDLVERARPVWSDRFELAINELHRLNEMVVARIVASIDPVILFIEGQPKRKERYGATGLLFLAIPLIYSMERKKFQQAGEMIERALGIEPDNTMAVTLAAYWHLWHIGQGWTPDVEGTASIVEKFCLKAMELDPDNSEVMGIYAHTLSWKREFDSALHFFDRSLRLNPNLAYIWALSAATYCYIGEPDNALRRLSRYLELAPLDPYFNFFENAYTIAYTFKRDYERAVVVGRRVTKTNPEFINGYKPLIASLGHLGRRDEARRYLKKLLSLEPDFTIDKFGKGYPFKFDRDRENYLEGLRLAGVPER